MRAVIQRVTSARVSIAGRVVAEIGHGFVVLVGIGRGDGADDVRYMAAKICQMRVFDGEGGRPNDRSLVDVGGSVLLVSQFTLYGDVRKGRRPSFDAAAPPEVARPVYDDLVRELSATSVRVATGEFRATMQIELVNDGPVTILLDSTRVS